MAYQLRTEKGLLVKHDGKDVMVADHLEVKIEQLDEKNKSFVAVASTEDVDRDNDIVRQAGWKLTNFKKNPVVPWSHNYYGVPIARSLKTWVDESNKQKGPRLLFWPKFDEGDEDSMKVFNKYKNGFLTSFSVGFRGIDWEFRDEENRWYGGREFTKQELLEISSCAIPANPNATTRLGVGGANQSKNLIQMGYPEVFAKTPSGLFYPIADIAVFSEPKEFEVAEGVIGVKAVPIDNDIVIDGPVGYIFDGEIFNDKSANEWIKENAKSTYTTKCFHFKFDDKDGLTMESVTEEDNIKVFEESIDLSNDDLSNKTPEGSGDVEDQSGKDQQTDTDTDGTSVSDTTDDSRSAGGDSTTGKSDGENDLDPNVGPDGANKTEDDTIAIPVKQMIEVVTTIKDSAGNVIDTMTETVASNKEFESVVAFIDWKSNQLISLFKKEIEDLKVLLGKKSVANNGKIPDNDNNLEDDDQKTITSEGNDDVFEVDESLIASPDSDDKNTSDNIIEIDDNFFEASKSSATKVVKNKLVETLKAKLKEVLYDASGKID